MCSFSAIETHFRLINSLLNEPFDLSLKWFLLHSLFGKIYKAHRIAQNLCTFVFIYPYEAIGAVGKLSATFKSVYNSKFITVTRLHSIPHRGLKCIELVLPAQLPYINITKMKRKKIHRWHGNECEFRVWHSFFSFGGVEISDDFLCEFQKSPKMRLRLARSCWLQDKHWKSVRFDDVNEVGIPFVRQTERLTQM